MRKKKVNKKRQTFNSDHNHGYQIILKRVKVKEEKKKTKELELYNFGAKYTGLIDLSYDYKQIKKLLRPRHIEYKLTFQ